MFEIKFFSRIKLHDLECNKCGWKGYKNQAEHCYWDFEFADYFCGNTDCKKPIPMENLIEQFKKK
jgi:hypothetical protein